MTRFANFAIVFLNCGLLYYILLEDWFPFCRTYHQLILFIYALISIVHGVVTFNDCPNAYTELKNDIEEANEALHKCVHLSDYL
uniref:Dolichol-phosphate mannosyltransferase subunit 3 n=1 Tax=Syphacia muris TaxID=451379 RepID=A0A0N5APL2_9BILA